MYRSTMRVRALAGVCSMLLLASTLHATPPVDPGLKNREEIVSLLLAGNAGALISHGLSASAVIAANVDEQGRVTSFELVRPSGNQIIDAALMHVAKKMVFEPTIEEGKSVKVRVNVPFVFGNVATSEPTARSSATRSRRRAAPSEPEPVHISSDCTCSCATPTSSPSRRLSRSPRRRGEA